VCYPAEHETLEQFLDAQFEHAAQGMTERGETAPAPDALPRAILAPHLDPRRKGHIQARAFSELGTDVGLPLRVVVYGTGHSLGDDFLALTRKRFETPFGQVPCDTEFVDRVAARLGDEAYRRELVHRDEHSIEFTLLYLQRRLRYKRFTLVPILCGGFHRFLDEGRGPRDEQVLEDLIAAVRDTERELGGPTLHVAAIDLSHCGPRFGDAPLDAEHIGTLEGVDQRAINAAAAGDADAWYRAIAEGEDSTRICGWAPTYVMLRCAEPGAGRPLAYDTSPEPDGSVVTVAAMVWP
jgi:AmmeMemoRadiSam system protein B